jgi:raffinose/stachyose/melibiose transport system substrate-binding protein
VKQSSLSRRGFLAAVGGLGAVSVLAACSSAAPASPTAAPAAPAAAAPTSAPATQPTSAAPPTTAAAPTTAPQPTAAPAAASAGPVTLQLWDGHPEWKDAMAIVVGDFTKTAPNVTIQVTGSSQLTNQLQTALNAGIGPDLFQTPSRPQLDVMSTTGQLLELNNRLDTSQWTQVAQDAVTVKGKIWAVPGGKYTVGIAYHIDLFQKAGVTSEPKTWADLTKAFVALADSKVIPYSIAAKDGSLTYFNYIGLASTVLGLDGFNAVVNGTKKLTEPDLVAVIQQMIDWGKYYEPNFVGTAYLESKALFATGKAAAMDAGSSDFNGFLQINPNAKLGFMYWPASDAMHQPCTNTGMEFMVGVNAKTKEQDAAVSFGRWLGTPAGAQAMTDNVKDLPVIQGVTPKDPLQQKMLATPLDVPVWYERFSTENIGQVWTSNGQAPFEGKATAAQTAQLLQDSINQQLAAAAKQQ